MYCLLHMYIRNMQTGDIRLEVLLEKGNKTRPYYFNRKSAEQFVLFSFMEFSTSAPNATMFNIPKECVKKTLL